MGLLIKDGQPIGGSSNNAKHIKFDNTNSGADASNVQDAIDEVSSEIVALESYDPNNEILIGTFDGKKVYRKTLTKQLDGGYVSFQLTNHSVYFIVSLEVFYSTNNGPIIKASLDKNTVVYTNGQINLNLTKEATDNEMTQITIVYVAND